MKAAISIQIYASVRALPSSWEVLASVNIFLSRNYLSVLDLSAPRNMKCYYLGFFKNQELVGIGVSQFLDLTQVQSFGERDQCLKTTIRNMFLKNFCSQILIMGNTMLTGQNGYAFGPSVTHDEGVKALKNASTMLQNIGKENTKGVHITSFKDCSINAENPIFVNNFKGYFRFHAQPNMLFSIRKDWKTESDYVQSFSKKYKDQYKRARKKASDVVKRKMELEDIIEYEDVIYELYYYVAKNAHFNCFFLAKNHFRVFKELLPDQFLFYGYFIGNQLVGFNTIIKNGAIMNTYFLGYDDSIQRDKMLYLNMLYDMVAYSIKKGFSEIAFARTALEIKSSIGAKPQYMFGFAKHSNPIAQLAFAKIYQYLEPKVIWKERHPFR